MNALLSGIKGAQTPTPTPHGGGLISPIRFKATMKIDACAATLAAIFSRRSNRGVNDVQRQSFSGARHFVERHLIRRLQRQLVYYDSLSNATHNRLLFLPTTFGRKNLMHI